MVRYFTPLFVLTCIISTLGAAAQGDGPFVVVDSGTEVDLESVYFPTPLVGYAGGKFITLLKTNDGGLTWETLEISGVSTPGFSDDPIIGLYFPDEAHGYMIIENFSAMYETLDGGTNWVALDGAPGDLCFPKAVAPFGADGLMLAGKACFGGNAVTVFEGGLWEDMSETLETDDSEIVDIALFGEGQIMLASTNGAIYRRASPAADWEKVDVNEDIELTSAHYIDGSTVYATSDAAANPLYESNNGGATWQSTDSPFSGFSVSLQGVLGGPDVIFFGADGEESAGFVSTVSGNGAPQIQTFNDPLSAGFTNGDGVHIIVGESGLIVRSDIAVSAEDAVQERDFMPYPNPATDKIWFSGLDQSLGTLRYRLVNLVGQVAAAGPISSEGVDVVEMSTGIYFLEVFRGDTSLGIRKMVIR